MMLCTECGYSAVNGRGVCLSCGHDYELTLEDNVLAAIVVGVVLVLCVGGVIWSVFEFMVFNHPG